ncbi:hypothetical protein D3C78_1510410 [compost metagenome]
MRAAEPSIAGIRRESTGEVALAVQVDTQHAVSLLYQVNQPMEIDRRFAYAALLVSNSMDVGEQFSLLERDCGHVRLLVCNGVHSNRIAVHFKSKHLLCRFFSWRRPHCEINKQKGANPLAPSH